MQRQEQMVSGLQKVVRICVITLIVTDIGLRLEQGFQLIVLLAT